MTAPSSRKPLPPDDGERKSARKRQWTRISEVLPPHDFGPWPEGLTLSREKDDFADQY